MALLALIGLICVLWILAKFFTMLGNLFDTMAKASQNKRIAQHFVDHAKEQREVIRKLKKINKKIDAMQEAQYKDRVRKEIEDLTK